MRRGREQETQRLPKEPDARLRLRAAYLEPWTTVAPMEALVSVYEKSLALGALHQEVSYWNITRNIEAREEMAKGVPKFLRLALKLMETQGEGSDADI